MILFEEDWAKYPEAVVHYTTTNKSFLRYVAVLKKMGVKNHLWPLALMNKELLNVDPFDPDITHDQIYLIQEECKWNPMYVLREIARFKARSGGMPSPYLANRGNMCLSWSFFNHIDIALIMIRQTGKSGSTNQLHNTITNVSGYGTTTQLYTKDHQLRKKNLEEIKEIRDLLPAYLNYFDPKKDADNTQEITCKLLKNEILTSVGQRSEDAAENVGRGIVSAVFHGDEVPYTPNCHISIPVAMASGNTARDLAAAAGGFYGNIFTTTAGSKDTEEGKYAYKLIHDGKYWDESLLDSKNIEELTERIRMGIKGERILINGTFSHLQLGKTDEWLRSKVVNAGGSIDSINRDFYNMWSSGSEKSPLDKIVSQAIRASQEEPKYVEITRDKYEVRWYVERADLDYALSNTTHLITLDSSQAVGKDNNGLNFLNTRDLSVTGASMVAEANIGKYAHWIAEYMLMYEKTIFVIENAASGQSILDIVAQTLINNGINPFKRIFNRLVGSGEERHQKDLADLRSGRADYESLYIKHKGLFGFKTNGTSRSHLYDNVLQRAARSAGHRIRDKNIIDELLALVEINNRVDHPKGGHDDSVISWLIGHWFLRHGDDLGFYGLRYDEILTEVVDDGAIGSEEDRLRRMESVSLRKRLEHIKEAIRHTSDVSAQIKLERQLGTIVNQIQALGEEIVSMDAIMTELRADRKKSKSLVKSLRRASMR